MAIEKVKVKSVLECKRLDKGLNNISETNFAHLLAERVFTVLSRDGNLILINSSEIEDNFWLPEKFCDNVYSDKEIVLQKMEYLEKCLNDASGGEGTFGSVKSDKMNHNVRAAFDIVLNYIKEQG